MAGGGGVDFVSAWIAAHIAAATALGKPLLIEEFGKVVAADDAATDDSERNPYYAAVYKARPCRPPAHPPAPCGHEAARSGAHADSLAMV